ATSASTTPRPSPRLPPMIKTFLFGMFMSISWWFESNWECARSDRTRSSAACGGGDGNVESCDIRRARRNERRVLALECLDYSRAPPGSDGLRRGIGKDILLPVLQAIEDA